VKFLSGQRQSFGSALVAWRCPAKLGHDKPSPDESGLESSADAAAAASIISGRRPPSAGLTAAARLGFERSHPIEQTAFVMTSTFASTIATSRLINYVREQRRPFPRTRHAGRLLTQLSGRNSVRVHHYLPGIGLSFTTGGLAIFRDTAPVQRWLSVPFAAGLALTTDELRLLAGRNNPYWGGEVFALAHSAAAALTAMGLLFAFVRRGLA